MFLSIVVYQFVLNCSNFNKKKKIPVMYQSLEGEADGPFMPIKLMMITAYLQNLWSAK